MNKPGFCNHPQWIHRENALSQVLQGLNGSKPENRIDPHMDTAEPEAETGQYQLITGYW